MPRPRQQFERLTRGRLRVHTSHRHQQRGLLALSAVSQGRAITLCLSRETPHLGRARSPFIFTLSRSSDGKGSSAPLREAKTHRGTGIHQPAWPQKRSARCTRAAAVPGDPDEDRDLFCKCCAMAADLPELLLGGRDKAACRHLSSWRALRLITLPREASLAFLVEQVKIPSLKQPRAQHMGSSKSLL